VARPFLDGAAVASCLPLGSAELAPLNKTALGKEVRFGYFFTAEATDQPGQKPAAFDLVLPKEGNGYTLETWYLYDWVQGPSSPPPPSRRPAGPGRSGWRQRPGRIGGVLAVATGVIPTVTHTPTPGHRSSGGCDAGAFPAVAVLLVLAPVAFLRRR
jgi:Synergist-CTERM protein sorting domain-containing protein